MTENLPKLTVSELTSVIKNTLEGSFFGLTIEGEISGFKPGSTGHWYFSLKDDNALLNAVIWKSVIPSIGFIPKDGQKVIVKGNLTVYPPRGTYQISCSAMKLAGEGDILAKLEERKRFYAAKGYFNRERKKSIPKRPEKVAIITSPTGAALQDILQVTGRRNASMNIIILPAVVQGEDAAATIAARIRQVNYFGLADVMIVGRGGGSIEDLLPFSEDCVIQAIYESQIPVISAVGHEIDWAISDFVADLRAPTPSAAAELVCESQNDQKQQLDKTVALMTDSMRQKLSKAKLALSSVNPESLRYILENKVSSFRMNLESSMSEMQIEINNSVRQLRTRTDIAKNAIAMASPIAIMERGYSIVKDSDGKTVKDIKALSKGSSVSIRFATGRAKADITEVQND